MENTLNPSSIQIPKACPMNYNPLCASDGKTYGNSCMYLHARDENPELYIVHIGRPCKEERMADDDQDRAQRFDDTDPCMKPCTREFRPICGSDNKTYSNPCTFSIAQCRYPGITKVRDGPC